MQEGLRFRGIGHQRWRISRTPRYVFARHALARDLLDRGNHFLHRGAISSAQVHRETWLSGGEMLEGFHMRVGQIIYMNVVADAGSIGSGIVRSENLQFRPEAGRGTQSQRDEVSFRIVQLTDFTALICAGSVEITQAGEAESVSAVVTFERLL